MSTGPKKSPYTDHRGCRPVEANDDAVNSAPSNEPHLDREARLRQQRDYAESIIDTLREPMLVLDSDLRVESASNRFYEVFGVTSDATVGQFLYDLGNGEWNIPALRQLLENVLPQQSVFRDFEVAHDFPSLGRRVMLLNGRTLGLRRTIRNVSCWP